MTRIALNELNIELFSSIPPRGVKSVPKFIGVFEHFYENVSTHYVDIAYEYKVEEIPDLPTEQHSEYKWFTIGELLESKQVHKIYKGLF
jgi:colanic acid biosynthesis protein WcaH